MVNKPLIIAHRGASAYAPENTLAAFNLAWQQGADGIEGDFRLTRDGRIVCFHDEETKRIAGKNFKVSERTLKQLLELDVGVWKGRGWKDTRMPTLAEVLETLPAGKRIFVEIKSGIEIVPVLIKEIAEAEPADDRMVLLSFSQEVVAACKKTAPQFKTLWLANFAKNRYGGLTPSLESVLATLQEVGADGFSSHYKHLDEAFVRGILNKGFEYHVWTIDDPEVAGIFEKYGANSITTNKPDLLRNIG